MRVFLSNQFKKKLKKQNLNFRNRLDLEIVRIAEDPQIGKLKKGDLSEVRVYKCYILNKLVLIAYMLKEEGVFLLAFGEHENFYRDIKVK